eukprot:6544331-Ditylum_brightwellii.AAC.1
MKVAFIKFDGYKILRDEKGKTYNGPAKFHGCLQNHWAFYELEPNWLMNEEHGWTKYFIQKCMNNKGNWTETEPGDKATDAKLLKAPIDYIPVISVPENLSLKRVPPLTAGDPV